MTSCWSKSSTGDKHPYYMCFTRGCPDYRKSIRRDDMEDAFEGIVRSLQPSAGMIATAKAMFRDAWDQRGRAGNEQRFELDRQIKGIDKQIESLVDRVVESDNAALIKAYEQKIAKLQKERLQAEENREKIGKPQHVYDEIFELAMAFLSTPWNLWESGQTNLRKLVLRLAFPDRISYKRGSGFSNAKKAFPFRLLESVSGSEIGMVHPTGFEPVTFAFGGRQRRGSLRLRCWQANANTAVPTTGYSSRTTLPPYVWSTLSVAFQGRFWHRFGTA